MSAVFEETILKDCIIHCYPRPTRQPVYFWIQSFLRQINIVMYILGHNVKNRQLKFSLCYLYTQLKRLSCTVVMYLQCCKLLRKKNNWIFLFVCLLCLFIFVKKSVLLKSIQAWGGKNKQKKTSMRKLIHDRNRESSVGKSCTNTKYGSK